MKKDEIKRVLIAGDNAAIIRNISGQLEGFFEISTSTFVRDELFKEMGAFKPHIVLAVLEGEQRKELYAFTSMKMYPKYEHIPLVVMGDQDDCSHFSKEVTADVADFLITPIDINQLKKTLDEIMTLTYGNDEDEDNTEGGEKKRYKIKSADGIRNVLVVDDDIMMFKLIRKYLGDEKYRVAVLPNGKLVMSFLEKRPTDLVLLDYMMPDLDGPAVLKMIRESEEFKDIPVIFLTSVAEEKEVWRCLELNPQGYILKPVRREDLLKRIDDVLDDE